MSATASGGSGRPKFDISKDQLEYLYSHSFNWPQIAQLLGVSRMTIYHSRVEFNLLLEPTGSISDAELQSTVNNLHTEHPEVGKTIVWGKL